MNIEHAKRIQTHMYNNIYIKTLYYSKRFMNMLLLLQFFSQHSLQTVKQFCHWSNMSHAMHCSHWPSRDHWSNMHHPICSVPIGQVPLKVYCKYKSFLTRPEFNTDLYKFYRI